jgi:PTS system beta-glucosides-specific IIC component
MAYGGDVILVGMFGTTFAQTGACIGIMLKTKDKKIKSLAPPAIISGIAGVTEPAIYGITLPKKSPYFRTCGIAAIAGAVMCSLGVKCYTMAGMGVFGYTAYINTATNATNGMFIAIVVSLLCVVAGIISELIFYKDDAPKAKAKAAETSSDSASAADNSGTVFAPATGKVVPLNEVKDEVFSSEAMGKGVAIEPSEGKIFAPVDGTIETFFPTGHAIGLTSDSGVEILIHVGMDTVDMNGDGFNPKKAQGDKVKKGDLLLEFDIAKIQAAGHPVTTPIIITNTDAFADVLPTDAAEVKPGDKLITLL